MLEEEHQTFFFFDAVKTFYISSLPKMFEKFPVGDHLLQDMGILVPDKVTSYSVDAVMRLAKCFPQLKIGDPTSIDKLRFYTLSHGPSYSN